MGIHQYDDNTDTTYYLNHDCVYLAQRHAEKYEMNLAQEKQDHAYYRDCLRAVWPGHSFATLPTHECRLDALHSFKKGDALAYPSKQPIMMASEDGFVLFQDTDRTGLILYHRDRPPMNLNVLANLPWPRDKDMLAFRDYRIKGFYASAQIRQPNPSSVTIKTGSARQKSISLADLQCWVQTFGLKDYNPIQLEFFQSVLGFVYPGILLREIHKLGARTGVVPLHKPFALIPPNTITAVRYDHKVFTLPENIAYPKYSTIIAEFTHEGSTHCLLLSFDLLTE